VLITGLKQPLPSFPHANVSSIFYRLDPKIQIVTYGIVTVLLLVYDKMCMFHEKPFLNSECNCPPLIFFNLFLLRSFTWKGFSL